jgi:D-sedoheptulose 7-phosphate isomerase
MHFTNDLLLCGIRAHCLDPATLAAFANDFGYETVFTKWLEVVGERGDLLIALSGSGKSPNILHALEIAKQIGMIVWPIFGADTGLDMQASEEEQLHITHNVMRWLRSNK